MTIKYETLMLARTEITDDELNTIENFFDKVCSDSEGKLTAFDKWGKYQLAYPVKKNSYGVYVLARYELPEKAVTQTFKNVETFLKIKCQETVLRNVTIKLAPEATIAYQKPEPLDSNRTGGIDAMLKEGKIENLLDSVESTTSKSAAPSTTKPSVVQKETPQEKTEENTENSKA